MSEVIDTADLPDEWHQVIQAVAQEIVDKLEPFDPRVSIIILQSCVFHHIYNRVKQDSWMTITEAFMSTALMTFDRWREEGDDE